MSKRKVLIVEDEKAIRKVMSEVLEQANLEVIEAADGKQGLDLALSEHPDIILLDINMPVMDGPTMLKHLRVDSWGKQVKVIILSNEDDSATIGASYFEGAVTEYIIKSNLSLSDLKKKVREAVILTT